MTNPYTSTDHLPDMRMVTKFHKEFAKTIVDYVEPCRTSFIPKEDTEKTVAGYLVQFEIVVRGAVRIEKAKKMARIFGSTEI